MFECLFYDLVFNFFNQIIMQKIVHATIAIAPSGIVISINQPIVKNALKMVPKGMPNR